MAATKTQEPIQTPAQLKEFLVKRGIKTTWFADQMNYDKSTVTNVLNGGQPMSDAFREKARQVIKEWFSIEIFTL